MSNTEKNTYSDKMETDKTDEEILALSLKKPFTFEILVERYQSAFLRKAFHILNNKEDAEDAVQECFTKIYFHAGRYKKQDGASFSSWAYKILMNTCFGIYKKRKRANGGRVFLKEEALANFPEIKQEFSPEEIKEKEDTMDKLLAFLSCLPTSASKILRQHFIIGMKQKDIAKEEKISVTAVKGRVFRAKKELRKIYEQDNKHF